MMRTTATSAMLMLTVFPAFAADDPCLEFDPLDSEHRSHGLTETKVIARCTQVVDGAVRGTPFYRMHAANLCLLKGFEPTTRKMAYGLSGTYTTSLRYDSEPFEAGSFLVLGVEGGFDFADIQEVELPNAASFASVTDHRIIVHETNGQFGTQRNFYEADYDRIHSILAFRIWQRKEDLTTRHYLYDVLLACTPVR